jgi:S1-C subfamily serine protease
MSRRTFVIAGSVPCIGLAALGVVLFAQDDTPRRLVPGQPVEVRHSDFEDPPVFRVDVPDAASALRVWTEGANVDVELHAMFLEPPTDLYLDGEIVSSDLWVDDELWLHVTDGFALEGGEWYFWAPLSAAWPIDTDGRTVEYTLHCEVVVPERTKLVLGEKQRVVLTRERGMLAAFECDLPAELVENDVPLRAEVFATRADVDLVVGPRGAARTFWEPYVRTSSSKSFERAVVGAATTGRRFALQVYTIPQIDPFDEVEVEVLLAVDEAGAPTICPAPLLPSTQEREPLANALAATVSLIGPRGGGSGVVVSPRGHVLTNAHVVSGMERGLFGDGPIVPLGVAFDRGSGEPVHPTLGARLLEYDERLDLALVVIESDLVRNPLPEGTRFPFFERRPVEEHLAIGDPVRCIGYPMTGGSHTFTTVSLTTGHVAGVSPEQAGFEYKVDAAVHSGVSGGACIDAASRLVGLPSSSVSDANEGGALGFVIPLERVPAAWWKHLEE